MLIPAHQKARNMESLVRVRRIPLSALYILALARGYPLVTKPTCPSPRRHCNFLRAMATSAVPGLEQVRKSRAYERMKQAKPDEFEPKTVYFATYKDAEKSIDWKNCLPLKEAIVYHAITKQHVNAGTKSKAHELLDEIAKKCKPSTKTPGNVDGDDEGYARVLDGIFLVVGFLSELKNHTAERNREKADSHYLMTHSEEIVKDIIKIENQLPLELIKDIVEKVEAATNEVVKNVLKEQFSGSYELSFKKEGLHGIISEFCWYYSPFHRNVPKQIGKDGLEKEKPENLLQCLHFSLKGDKSNGKGTGQVCRSPSARQLKRSGVRFEASSDGTIDIVRFTKPNLKMPVLVYDFKLETVVWNLLAWECLPKEEQKPVTRYLQFTNELVGDLGDVRVMNKFGLIKGRWKNLREVLDLVKRIDGSASYPSVYMALDEHICLVLEYHDERMKSFFVRNRPAVLWFSSVAAASVIATAIYASKRRREG